MKDPVTAWLLKAAAVCALLAGLLVTFGLLAGDADAAKPDPWHAAPSPAQEWAGVKAFALGALGPGVCGEALTFEVQKQPRLPWAYVSQGAVGDEDAPAGAAADGYHIGPPVDGQPWVPGVSCTIVVKQGTPMRMCDIVAHEILHDHGARHGDGQPTMEVRGDREFWPCHSSPAVRSLERYAQAFRAFPGMRCRARADWLVQCKPWPRAHTALAMDFRGVRL